MSATIKDCVAGGDITAQSSELVQVTISLVERAALVRGLLAGVVLGILATNTIWLVCS